MRGCRCVFGLTSLFMLFRNMYPDTPAAFTPKLLVGFVSRQAARTLDSPEGVDGWAHQTGRLRDARACACFLRYARACAGRLLGPHMTLT